MVSEIKVDTISEKTSANGISIDSVVHKDSAVYPSSADGGALGSASNEWSDLFLADSSVIKFGADQDTTLTHTDGTGLTLNSTNKLCFNDVSQFVQGISATVLGLGATDEIDLTATAIDINGTCDISGTFSLGGTNITTTAAEINLIDGGTARGTTALADGDGVLINDGGTMRMTNVTAVKTYMSTSLDGIDDQTSSNDDQLTITDSEIVINEDSDDLDFRVESNSNTHALFVDGAGAAKVQIGSGTAANSGGLTSNFEITLIESSKPVFALNNFQDNDGGGKMLIFKSRSETVGSFTIIQDDDVIGGLAWAVDDGGDYASQTAIIDCRIDGTPGADDVPARMGFAVCADGQNSPTERFRISENGDLTATDTSIGSLSDERLKQNIRDYTYSLDTFKQYRPRMFDWINPGDHSNKADNRGFIAQEIEAVDDYWSYNYKINKESADYGIIEGNRAKSSKLDKVDAMYISVIQQLITKIETLETKVTALEG